MICLYVLFSRLGYNEKYTHTRNTIQNDPLSTKKRLLGVLSNLKWHSEKNGKTTHAFAVCRLRPEANLCMFSTFDQTGQGRRRPRRAGGGQLPGAPETGAPQAGECQTAAHPIVWDAGASSWRVVIFQSSLGARCMNSDQANCVRL